MARRDEILDYLNTLLDVSSFKDYGPQGAQLLGVENIQKIVVGVSCSLRFFERAIEKDADMVITHHGLFWDHDSRICNTQIENQMRLLLENEVTLASYHLALDAHMEIGNNVLLAELLDPNGSISRFADIGAALELDRPTVFGTVEKRLRFADGLDFGFTALGLPSVVSRVAVVTGRGGRYFQQAIDEGYDLFITGEAEEWAQAMARENGVGFLALGHYNSEKLGVQAIGKELALKFGIDYEFVDVPNRV